MYIYKGKSFGLHLVLPRAISALGLYTALTPPLAVGKFTRLVAGLLSSKRKARYLGTSGGSRGEGEEGKQRRVKKALAGGV